MTIISLRQAKADLESLLDRAQAGEVILITRETNTAFRIVPVAEPVQSLGSARRASGSLGHLRLEQKAEGEIDGDAAKQGPRRAGSLAHLRDRFPRDLFLEPMSEEEIEAWEGKYSFPYDNGQ